jgi:hypothetical protein
MARPRALAAGAALLSLALLLLYAALLWLAPPPPDAAWAALHWHEQARGEPVVGNGAGVPTFARWGIVKPHGYAILARALQHAGWHAANASAAAARLWRPPAADMLMVSVKSQPATALDAATEWLRPGSILNRIVGSGCIGGSKTLQLECRRDLAVRCGCKGGRLRLQPPQWRLDRRADCLAFFAEAGRRGPAAPWILKPAGSFHGKGIELHRGFGGLVGRFGGCPSPDPAEQTRCDEAEATHTTALSSSTKGCAKRWVVMEYVGAPALLEGHKFDLRTFLIVTIGGEGEHDGKMHRVSPNLGPTLRL